MLVLIPQTQPLALGINHKTAPVSLRERVTFSPDTLDQALDSVCAAANGAGRGRAVNL